MKLPLHPQARRPSARGITLVEILVAIGILGLVLVAIYSTWTSIMKATRVGLDAAAAAQRERMAMRVIQEALASARLYVANWQWYWFAAENGDDASLSFVSHLPASFPRGGKFGDLNVRRVAFALEAGPDGERQLVLRQTPLMLEVDRDEAEHPLVLARNVKELNFEFWDPRKGEWIDEWRNTNQIPQLVKIRLVLNQARTYSTWGNTAPPREITRVVGVHAVGVQPQWQIPGAPGQPQPGMPQPLRPGVPGQPLPPGTILPPGQMQPPGAVRQF